MTRIRDIASICRSKNAGPFLLTIDILFDSREKYDFILNSGTMDKAEIARRYKVSEEDVEIYAFDAVTSIKVTIPRLIPSGSRYDTDVFGAQQHTPIMEMEVKGNYQYFNK